MSRGISRYLQSLKRLVVPGGNLTRRTVTSGIWLTALNGFNRLLQILLLIILARLLDPTDFGLMGIALLALAALNQFSQLGLQEALVYSEDENIDRYLDTTWSMNALRGILLAAVMIVGAPAIGWVFGEPKTVDIMRVMAISPLIFGIRNPGVIYFRKDLKFHLQFAYEMSGSLIQFIVAVAYALAFSNVWALVFGYLASDIVKTIVSFKIQNYRPWLELDREVAKELIDYGKWITGSSITNFFKSQGDDAFIGWALSASALGFYQMGYRLSNAPATEVTHVISGVMFPTYSKLQNDITALRKTYFRVLRLTSFVVMPAAVGIAVVSPTFVAAVLGEDWLPMVLTMQLLAIYGLGRAIAATFGPIWKAIGRPDYQTKMQGFSLVLILILIFPATMEYGIAGTAAVLVAVDILVLHPLEAVITARELETSLGRMLQPLVFPLVASIFMGAMILFVQQTLGSPASVFAFVELVIVGAVSYGGIVAILETQFGWGLLDEIDQLRSAL